MCVIRNLFISCGVLVCMNLTHFKGSPLCCVEVFADRSVKYTVETTACTDTMWSRNETPIKDQQNNVDKNIVHDFGANWILLNGRYPGIAYTCMDLIGINTPVQCRDPCQTGEDALVTEVPGCSTPSNEMNVSVIVVIVITIIVITAIIIISWKTGCYRNCRGDTARRHEAVCANGGIRAVRE